ncbi:NAD(P)H-hydrate dehydratase [Halopseudomonas maritima]|uniref:NAD(P)H-hydrate dehydratase n=1 Tax=Halopseudomonas maritima TaxID=2918528 RepID=UPI001EEAA1C1|nr:NAD(P)H-hydrate dehydratase [Halopseudomonas maritima]UJJ30850.1 NAD(P)H-hydrate dehydratase [Halopseudomonas maritima]
MLASAPLLLHSREQTRALDAALIASGLSGLELMQRAADAAWTVVQQCWPRCGRMTVLCGSGNNAGDGYLLARLAHAAGWQVSVLTLSPPERLRDDAALAWQQACAAGIVAAPWCAGSELAGVVVDAMLGTGLRGQLRALYAEAIAAVNQADHPVLALDIPSGLDADCGVPLGLAVCATATVTFISVKPGLLTGQGPEYCGRLEFAPLVAQLPESVPAVMEHLLPERWLHCLPPRQRAAHKGHFGHLLLVGGGPGMGGAIMLAAEAALYAGAGKVSVATAAEHVAPMLARQPEVMVHAVAQPSELQALLLEADAVVVGPGLGKSTWAQQCLDACLALEKPRVLDADALNLLAAGSVLPTLGAEVVITPHPAEAARLLEIATAEVSQDRLGAARQLVEQLGCQVVLKGAGSLIAGPQADALLPALCSAGNPGMAVGGMGDVLSGLLGALLAQRVPAAQAARYAVLVHALAGDRLAQAVGEVGLRASEMAPVIRSILNQRGAV